MPQKHNKEAEKMFEKLWKEETKKIVEDSSYPVNLSYIHKIVKRIMFAVLEERDKEVKKELLIKLKERKKEVIIDNKHWEKGRRVGNWELGYDDAIFDIEEIIIKNY